MKTIAYLRVSTGGQELKSRARSRVTLN